MGAGTLNQPVRRENIEYIVTDKDTNFTGALIQNAQEQENIIGLSSSRGTIESVSIQSDQNLEWDIFFFTKDSFENVDLDLDTFLEYVNFPVSLGKQIAGSNQFYYAQTNLLIPYKDEDSPGKELHIALVNRSATSKNAGATGEITIRIGYRPDGEGEN